MTEKLISVYIMGKKYEVPSGLTIMKAMEYAGYKIVRGAGCRAGFCGACATVYRTAGDYRLKIALACQAVAEPEMYIAQIPFFPAERAEYRLDELEPTFGTLVKLYPELLRDIDVKDYMAEAMRGNIAAVANKSFDCIMCGLCTARCPAEEAQYNIAILCRRLYGKYLAPKARHLSERVAEIKAGDFDESLREMKSLGEEELRQRYNERDIEPD